MIIIAFSSLFRVGSVHFRGGCCKHFSSVQCCYSRQQRSPSATRNAQFVRGLGMQCSDRHQRSTRIRTHPHWTRSRSPDQVRICFVRMVGSSTGSHLDRSSGCCVVTSVARLIPAAYCSSRDHGTTPSLPHRRHNVRNRRTRPDRRETLKPPHKQKKKSRNQN